MKNKITVALLVVTLVISSAAYSQIYLLSGSEQGSYHAFGEDIVNAVAPSLGVPLVNTSTSGAAYNFNQITDPESPYKLAMIQSDYLYFMQALDNRDNTSKTKSLKVLLPLAHEEIHLVTKKNKGLTGLKDLEGKTVAIGTQDQGTYATASLIKDRSQVSWTSRNVHFDQALNDLYMDRLDAFFFVGSAPVQKLDINPQAMVDQLALVSLEDFNDWARYYDNDTIYAGDYKWLESDVPTYGVKNLLVVNESKLSADEKNKMMKLKMSILNKFDDLKKNGHPKWKEVDFADWNEADWPLYE